MFFDLLESGEAIVLLTHTKAMHREVLEHQQSHLQVECLLFSFQRLVRKHDDLHHIGQQVVSTDLSLL